MRFAYEHNGGIAIVIAALKSDLEQAVGALTDDEYRARVIGSIPPDAMNVVELPGDWIPPDDRTFRNAWVFSGAEIVVDMTKAREIHRNALRRMREPKLASLDVEYLNALETNDTAKMSMISAKKQALRDVTNDPKISAAKTPDELKQVVPDVLL
jgi:hypothetical protein